jgi:methyl-accepting chemotaxis protein
MIFVGIAMFSLFTAFIVCSWIFDSRAKSLIQEILTSNGNQMIQTYQSTPSAQLIPFMQNLSGLSPTLLQLYSKDGEPLLDQKEWPIQVQPNDIDRVLAGEMVSDSNKSDGPLSHTAHLPVIGLPFQVDGQPYALFVTMKKNSVDKELMNSIHLMYVIILFLGSFLILIAARYIVNPILRLTDATKKMAKGNFDVELPTNRKDEIGVLSVSFNEMAKELAKLEQMRRDLSPTSHMKFNRL